MSVFHLIRRNIPSGLYSCTVKEDGAMSEVPLVVPFLISPPPTDAGLPVRVTHIASWTEASGAAPSKRLALAGLDNTIWITNLISRSPSSTSRAPTAETRPLNTTSTSSLDPSTPAQTPSKRRRSQDGRPRAPSTASSAISSSSAHRRRASAFSPPPSILQPPTATLSSATAVPDMHVHRDSQTEHTELLDHLREQRGPDPAHQDDRSALGLGLGFSGIGRRGLPGVHGKEERDHDHSGASSPKSGISAESSKTVGSRLRAWTYTTGTVEEESEELKERIEEIQVDREMEREMLEEEKEMEDMKVVEEAWKATTPKDKEGVSDESDIRNADEERQATVRVVLPSPGMGKVVFCKVIEEVGLCVLRDIGLLDVISTSTHSVIASIHLETPEDRGPSDIASSSKAPLRLSPFWQWKGLHSTCKEETVILIAHGVSWPCGMPSPNGEVTRVVMLNFDRDKGLDFAVRLELPGEGDVATCRSGDTGYLLHATPTSLTSYPVVFPSRITSLPPTRPGTPRGIANARAVSSAFPSPLVRSTTPNPPEQGLRKTSSVVSLHETASDPAKSSAETGFAKFLAARRADWGGRGQARDDGLEEAQVSIGEGMEVVMDGYGVWSSIQMLENGDGLGVADDAIDIFFCNGRKMSVKGTINPGDGAKIQHVEYTIGWRDVCVSTEKTLLYRPHDKGPSNSQTFPYTLVASFDPSSAITLSNPEEIVLAHRKCISTIDVRAGNPKETTVLRLNESIEDGNIAILVPLDMYSVFVGDSRGTVRKRSMSDVLGSKSVTEDQTVLADRLDSPLTCMCLIAYAGKQYLAAGDEDGVVRIWSAEPFELLGSWTLFADPVHTILRLDVSQAGVLLDSVLCTSRDGTIGVISLREMDQLFLIPAARAPLRRIFLGGKDILLAYANGKARVWNVETCEFRRSTALDAGEDMLQSGDWAELPLESRLARKSVSPMTPALSLLPENTDLGRMLQVDVRHLGKWLQTIRPSTASSPLEALKTLLSICLIFGMNDVIDDLCTRHLGIVKSITPVSLGTRSGSENSFPLASGKAVWGVAAATSGMRQLLIVSLLRPFLDVPELERHAAEVIAFHCSFLPLDSIQPDLACFAAYYLDSASDVHQAAKMLFTARLDKMSEADIELVVQVRLKDLPSSNPAASRYREDSAIALTIIGGMAIHKYQSINPSALRSVSESLMLCLGDPSCPILALAIELCSKGFSKWQTFVDPMELLRRLFQIATRISSHSAQARLASLHVASSNPALFMSTLSMDILDAKSAEGRKSIMKLCVFMARKKPKVFEHGLPRIAEAVVKSLDPNVGKMRDDVWQTATVILNELVLAFSTIDFHSGTQRLAVGTHEGAVIMYDLKTASRLYVLEPHKAAVSSVTFSPDGRRLVTVSLGEGCVTVWKVGSSLSGFFNVGGPPRQGAGKGIPFKRIEFKRADEGTRSGTSALSEVKVEWLGPRQARVMISETALTFET